MKIQIFKIGYQLYLVPTIIITHSLKLHGYYDIQLRWLKWGIELILKKKK